MHREEYLKTHQVAEILGVTTQTIYNWVKQGKVPEPHRNPITKYRLWTPRDVERIREIITGRNNGED